MNIAVMMISNSGKSWFVTRHRQETNSISQPSRPRIPRKSAHREHVGGGEALSLKVRLQARILRVERMVICPVSNIRGAKYIPVIVTKI